MIQNYTFALPIELIFQLNGEKYWDRTSDTKFPINSIMCIILREFSQNRTGDKKATISYDSRFTKNSITNIEIIFYSSKLFFKKMGEYISILPIFN